MMIDLIELDAVIWLNDLNELSNDLRDPSNICDFGGS